MPIDEQFPENAERLCASIIAHVGNGQHQTRAVAVAALAFVHVTMNQLCWLSDTQDDERERYHRVIRVVERTAKFVYGCDLRTVTLQ